MFTLNDLLLTHRFHSHPLNVVLQGIRDGSQPEIVKL